MKLSGCDSKRRLSQIFCGLRRRCIKDDRQDEREVCEQHHEPRDFAVLICRQVKDARREIDEQSDYTRKIESAGDTVESSARRLARYFV